MKILLTGANGYIGKRLLPVLIDQGHQVVCCVRDKNRFNVASSLQKKIELIQVDLLKKESLKSIPIDIDGAYYLVHSMSSAKNYEQLETQSAINFREAINKTKAIHVIYLSAIINSEYLSKHFNSRRNVENQLKNGNYALTTLRAGIIIGSGSASFEIIRDLVEKLPVMITPKWVKTKSQPIGIANVISLLSGAIFHPETKNKSFDIGGADVLTYKEMMLGYAKARNLNRKIWVVPVMTPKLSSYWLYFVTSTSYRLATSLVSSMKVEAICKDNHLFEILNIMPLSYQESLKKAFTKIENNEIISSWKDAYVSSGFNLNISEFINVPSFGCYKDHREAAIINKDLSIEKIWKIGGKTGWYSVNWLWQLRGFLDKLVGGVGLKRGRTNYDHINTGDTLDFWRVLYANKEEGRLLLFAEMKLPGEAWLEFKFKNNVLSQTATFRPLGLAGRIYWYFVYPFHGIIFKKMIQNLAN